MRPIEFATPPRRILIIKPSAIGDVVHALPILNLLRRRWPGAKFSWLLTPACAGLLEHHPQVDEIIRFDRRLFGQGWWNPIAIVNFAKFTAALRRRRFDLVIDLQGLLRSALLGRLSGAPIRIGPAWARELGWVFHTHSAPGPREARDFRHAIDRYLDIAEALGCPREPVEFRFAVTDDDRISVAHKLTAAGYAPKDPAARYAVLLPGSNWETKRWPAERFAGLVDPLRRLGLEPIIAGGPGDADLAAQIPALSLTGQTSLAELTALLERAAIVIANDSGPMHIASALGRPLVALYGPTHAIRTGPFGRADTVLRLDLPCSPCYSRRCSHQSCMTLMETRHVMERVKLALGESARERQMA